MMVISVIQILTGVIRVQEDILGILDEMSWCGKMRVILC